MKSLAELPEAAQVGKAVFGSAVTPSQLSQEV